MVAYLHYFDEQSKVSMLGATIQYTTTNSQVGGVFANSSFGADHHRLAAFVGGGLIKNDYNDYLGTGIPLKTEDNLGVFAGRYLYRVKGDWFVGLQAVHTNYQVIGETALDEQILNVLGMTSLQSSGIGAIAMYDTRNSEYAPTRGMYMNLNNMAYRDFLGGADSYDAYRLDIKGYWEHAGGQVFALRQSNKWSVDAPPAAAASVLLRGYKPGQYLGKYMSSLEGEERLRFAQNWGATIFAGIACLYGDGQECSDSSNRYANFGAGVQYVIKQKEGMVLNLEYAQGKADNYGVYMQFGYGY
jgi:hypothetical protein